MNALSACCRLIRLSICIFEFHSHSRVVIYVVFSYACSDNLWIIITLMFRWLWQKKLLYCSQKMVISTTTYMICSACGLYLIMCNISVHTSYSMVSFCNTVASIFWRYELASAESYFRQGDLGLALKKFLAVEKHHADITEDQFDFHSYCLRKMTLRQYVEMLKFQDQLHSHAYFHKAAAGAIRWIYAVLNCFTVCCYPS